MICNVCNKEVENGTDVCPYCGADLTAKEAQVITLSFKKPNPPPVITVSFVEPTPAEPEYVEPEYIEPEYVEPEPEYTEPKVEPAPAKASVKKKKKKEKKPKKVAKDRVNPLFVLLSLLWAPYPGILLWVLTSKKTPKASRVYGNCGIIVFTIRSVWRYVTSTIMSVVTTVLTIVIVFGGIAALTAFVLITQYNITFA